MEKKVRKMCEKNQFKALCVCTCWKFERKNKVKEKVRGGKLIKETEEMKEKGNLACECTYVFHGPLWRLWWLSSCSVYSEKDEKNEKIEKYEKYKKIEKNEIRIIINAENFSKLEFAVKSLYFFITKRFMITEIFQNYKLWRETCKKEHQMVS